MEDIIKVQCKDMNLILANKGKIFGDFICYDVDNQSTINILVPIHEQINEIYRNIKITIAFVKRLEYKLKLTLRARPANLTFIKQKEGWSLQTPFSDIYEPVTLTFYGIKMGELHFTIDGQVLRILSCNGRILLLCLVEEIDVESNDFVQKVKTIRITEEVSAIYNDMEAKEKFLNILNIKVKNKKAFANALSEYLEGKILDLEYDEHYGYSLWTSLYDFVDVNEGNK